MLFLALYRVFESIESLPFDNRVEADIVRRFTTTAKICPRYRESNPRPLTRQAQALATQERQEITEK